MPWAKDWSDVGCSCSASRRHLHIAEEVSTVTEHTEVLAVSTQINTHAITPCTADFIALLEF